MKNPNLKTRIVHSQSKNAWNVIGTQFGGRYKIARVPYIIITDNEIVSHREKQEALEIAEFINYCFNNSDLITK